MIYTFNGMTPQIHPTAYIAPGAQIIGNVIIEENASVWFNAVLRGDNDLIRIGKGSNIQDGCVVHTDTGYPVHVEENVTVGHQVMLHGCIVKSGTLIGMGATLLNGSVIGSGSLVAANALILEGKTVEPGSLVAGAPAKFIREVTPDNQARILNGAEHYRLKAQQFKENHIV